jgi:fumarate hydratase subunit beta
MAQRTNGKKMMIAQLNTPLNISDIKNLQVGDPIEINGIIYCGRDAVLPKITRRIELNSVNDLNINLKGSVIFHTAVSKAGIGPTTSSKVEIEGSIPLLSKAGVKIHLGKGAIGSDTVKALQKYNAVFAVTPPTSALFSDKMISQRVAAYPEEGMEALFEIEVKGFPAIIASAHGKTLWNA